MSEPNSEYADVTDHVSPSGDARRETRSSARRERDAIIQRCLPLADHIARRFRNRGEPLEDLVQVARVGLMNAVNRFNVDNGAEFIAFAVPTIMGEVRRHFRDHGWSVKVPRRLKDLNSQLKRCREELSHQLGRAPTASEIAAALGIDREEVVQGQIASSAYTTLSSDAPMGAVTTTTDVRSRTQSEISTPIWTRCSTSRRFARCLAALPEREQTVLRLRFFENMTQTQIAARLGISQMHVSRLLARSLDALRRQIGYRNSSEPERTSDSGRRRGLAPSRGVTDGCELKPPSDSWRAALHD